MTQRQHGPPPAMPLHILEKTKETSERQSVTVLMFTASSLDLSYTHGPHEYHIMICRGVIHVIALVA